MWYSLPSSGWQKTRSSSPRKAERLLLRSFDDEQARTAFQDIHAPAHVCRDLAILHSFFKWAKKKEYIDEHLGQVAGHVGGPDRRQPHRPE